MDVISAKDTPELTNPKSGKIPKLTQGARLCSACMRGDIPCSFLSLRGMQKAVRTPAIVACTAEFSTQIHRMEPSKAYGISEAIPLRLSTSNPHRKNAPMSSGSSSIWGV